MEEADGGSREGAEELVLPGFLSAERDGGGGKGAATGR